MTNQTIESCNLIPLQPPSSIQANHEENVELPFHHLPAANFVVFTARKSRICFCWGGSSGELELGLNGSDLPCSTIRCGDRQCHRNNRTPGDFFSLVNARREASQFSDPMKRLLSRVHADNLVIALCNMTSPKVCVVLRSCTQQCFASQIPGPPRALSRRVLIVTII